MSSKPYAQSLFTKSALLSGLVSDAQIRSAVVELIQTGRSTARRLEDVTDRELSQELIDRGLVTSYQADQLRAGRTKLSLGNYVITDWIGQGGMGQVFKGMHQVMGRIVAIKVLPLSKTTDHAVDNFMREIRTQAQLDHPNLVRAYDAGKDGNVHYLVVEYVPGTDLRRLVRSRGKLSIQQAASIIRQAAEGLEYAHRRKLIHRDVKPGNILVTPEGVAKVSDLGLAAFMSEGENDPRHGKIVGTADYLSPEQIRNPRDVTKSSDLYSLGCTLYYAVTGKVPFPGGNAKNKARRHLEETPWHPRRFNEEVSDEFVDLIADMMEKEPANRIESALEVAHRLEPWASDVSPISGAQMTRSRWQAAPLPTDRDEDLSAGVDTDSAFSVGDLGTGDLSQASQGSQGTVGGLGSLQDTSVAPDSAPPPPPLMYDPTGYRNQALRRTRLLFRLIWLGIPAALMFGFIVGFLVGRFFR
ncbi:MAG TPA: serine/threonine-protein kinase [Pirellulaceae bacterium]|nr:serine/threonine-protein kinase [Pirellulaceae bacterium]